MMFGPREIAYSLILVVVIILSAFFSGSETAFMRANRFRIRSLSEKGNREARRVETILENPDRLISVILLGNNFVNILGSAIATALFLSIFGDRGILLASLAMTVILLIFSEITPKTIAAYRADTIAMIVAYPVSLIIRLLGPIARLMSLAAHGILSVFRFKQEGADKITEEDVESVITMGHKEGFIEEPKARMLVAVMDLDNVPVKKIMMPLSDMEFLPIDVSFEDIRKTIAAKNYSRYPVYEGERDNIVGYLHIRDLWRYVDNPEAFQIRDCLREAHFIPETKPILKQLIDFQQMHLHIAFVVDEYGTVKGGITLEDIIEEITGDIIDEHDIILAHVIPVGERSFIITGNISLRDLGRYIDREFPEEYDTLSGLIYELLDRIPEEGDKVTWQDMQFRIERMRGNRISRVRVTIKQEEE
ncbi:MAG: CNNM domain-containing protein [Pseudomonadota bacterium]|jgi:putative hemolysin|uniref:Magnesium and cobalt efflux protein CorC n=1 Tax=anaerobic digester metagenome TaxID=1263854 RepID=A0A485LYK0_9ZZZZ|nr:CNNM domain-containing protein [Pseudomonadota bacterium]HON39606.1 CNNM domain-containing protein [Deltaproteobacteria bacterium]HRS57346.1 CNNM domain-containing protein [Desulfomonilia bacterium]HPD22481.1 CNNM domain-containing protein [Deltaproteobacteria bacterium]HPX19503.1 CNNM domain-containing protein [Deltaproteobacteria bacterium]